MIEVSYPYIFILLPLPLIIYWFSSNNNKKSLEQNALKVPFYNNLIHLFANSKTLESTKSLSWYKYILLIMWLLLITAGSGINILGKEININRSGRDLYMLIDLSGSMNIADMTVPNNPSYYKRIDIVKYIAEKFINNRKGDQIGLTLFGSHAYIQAPLTYDVKTVANILDDATVGLAGSQTAIGDAIGITVKQLINSKAKDKAMILLTDGDNNSGTLTPLEAAKLAQKAHIKIYAIGLGGEAIKNGGQILNPSSDEDFKTLKEIANLTGGQFYRATDANTLVNIYNQINQLEPVKTDDIKIKLKTPVYPWILGVMLIMSFVLIILKVRRQDD